MVDVVLDNIVFDLQRHGGISTIWQGLVAAAADAPGLDIAVMQSAQHNTHLQEIIAPNTAGVIADPGPVLLRRFANVRVPKTTRVFHSSYFRTTAQRGVKNIVTVHDCIAERFDTGPRRLLHLWQKKRALRRAETVICVSHNTRDDLLHFYPDLPPQKLCVIHNGIDLGFFSPQKSPQTSPDKTKVQNRLLYVGARTKHKNFDMALRLLAGDAATSRGLGLDVVGGGPFTKAELSTMRALGIAQRVNHLGSLSRTALRTAYRQAYALVYPSHYEGFGIPPLEAMACGCPVLCSKASSLPEVVGEAAESFDPANPAEADAALARLALSGRRDALIAAGLDRAARFPMERMTGQVIDLYRALAGRGDAV